MANPKRSLLLSWLRASSPLRGVPPCRIPLWGLLLLGGGLLACTRPLFESPAKDPLVPTEVRPAALTAESAAASSVWLITDASFRAQRASEQRFSRLDSGLFWLNLLELSHGRVAALDVQTLDALLAGVSPAKAEGLDQRPALTPSPKGDPAMLLQLETLRRLVVFSRGALEGGRVPSELIRRLAQQGHTVVLEQPSMALAQSLSLAEPASPDTLGRGLHAWTLRAPAREDWQARHFGPFWSLHWVPLLPSGEVDPFLWAERPEHPPVPVGWAKPVEQGRVVTLSLELSRLLLTHVQGNPQEDFSFQPRPRQGALRGIPVPSDMALLETPRRVPVLELLARRLYLELSRGLELGDLWYFPQGMRGIYLSSHDEEGFGARARFMAEEEARLGVRSTYFVLPEPMTAEGLAGLHALGAEVALHWHRGFLGGNTDELRLGPLWWRSSAWTLAEQQQRLTQRAGRDLPPLTRIHGLQWDPDFDSTFRRLVAAGFQLDSSYGPHGARGPYEFGWSHAFQPLDRAGERLPLYEVPFSLQDDEAAPQEKNRQLILEAGRQHFVVSPIFHVNTMSYKPSVGILEAWQEGYGLARAQGLWITTYGDFLRFLERRVGGQAQRTAFGWRCEGGEGLAVALPRRIPTSASFPPAGEVWVLDVGVPRRLMPCHPSADGTSRQPDKN